MMRSMDRLILLMTERTYRATAFMEAAARLGLPVVVASERPQVLEAANPEGHLTIPFGRPDEAVARIAAFARDHATGAVLATDDDGVVIAARAAAAIGLAHSSAAAVAAARDKHATRRLLEEAGERTPWFERHRVADDPEAIARTIRYPCVIKPLALSASRGVIRADDPVGFVEAFRRVAAILASEAGRGVADERREWILVEEYLDGEEMALEGILDAGRLRVLALFDKPDRLTGPYFEESIYVTPTRRPDAIVRQVEQGARRAVAALGLTHGPVHIEMRLDANGPWVVEVAPRSIGGLCARTLRFGEGMGLEEIILLAALGRPVPSWRREARAAAVMMIPIPAAGVLRGVEGVEGARAVEGIEDVMITIPPGGRYVPLPEGDRYLGFLFARADRPDAAEAALREAHRRLRFDIAPVDSAAPTA